VFYGVADPCIKTTVTRVKKGQVSKVMFLASALGTIERIVLEPKGRD
jgi:hypothetical protein